MTELISYPLPSEVFVLNQHIAVAAVEAAPADGVIYRTKVALEYDAKMYIFNVKIMNRETANGIENIDAANKVNAGNVYDLSGRLVRKNATSVKGLANGVYLLNGKKYIVK